MLLGSKADKAYQIFIHFFVGAIAASALLPLFYVLGMSFTTLPEMVERNFFVLIPKNPTIEAYRRILGSVVIWRGLSISIFRATTGPLITLFFTFIGAFILSRKDLPGRKYLLFMVLATILFNGGLIPTYLVITKLQLNNSLLVFLAPFMVDSFGLLVIKVFIENISTEIISAAEIDGASDLDIMVKIALPLAVPSLTAIGMFNIVTHWNSWFDGLLYIQNKSLYPFQLILRNMLATSASLTQDSLGMSLVTATVSNETMKMAAVVTGIIPILCLYPFLQKHFTKGMYLGAVKG